MRLFWMVVVLWTGMIGSVRAEEAEFIPFTQRDGVLLVATTIAVFSTWPLVSTEKMTKEKVLMSRAMAYLAALCCVHLFMNFAPAPSFYYRAAHGFLFRMALLLACSLISHSWSMVLGLPRFMITTFFVAGFIFALVATQRERFKIHPLYSQKRWYRPQVIRP